VFARDLVVVDVDALELEVEVAVIATAGVDVVLYAHHLLELDPGLVAVRTTLDLEDISLMAAGCHHESGDLRVAAAKEGGDRSGG
jgi:hypothetical protein